MKTRTRVAIEPQRAAESPAAARFRFHSLDVLRGFAALAVVFWHWQHFFYEGECLGTFDRTRQPLYAFLAPLYSDSLRAVELFFFMSGFVHAWFYAGPIARREVSTKEFAVLRFSRLYPLYAATLVLVAFAQVAFFAWRGDYLVYTDNDLLNFGLSATLTSGWGFVRGCCFNGPALTVSIEALLYVAFFSVCRAGWYRGRHFLALALLACVAERAGFDERLARGLAAFFAGCAAAPLCVAIERRRPSLRVLAAAGAACVALWCVLPAAVAERRLMHLYWDAGGVSPFVVRGHDLVWWAIHLAESGAQVFLLFPLTVVALALAERRRGSLGRRIAWIGEVTYSSYLLHFPLQMLFVTAALAAGASTDVFYSWFVLAAFFAALVPLSLACHRRFEQPAQRWLRAALLGPRTTRAGVPAT